MAEYKGIKGFKVQSLDADPVPTVAGWSAGGNLNTARDFLGGAGTQTASLAFGGLIQPPNANSGATEEYDGTNWATSPGSMNTARSEIGSTGTQTAALAFLGQDPSTKPTQSEEYDGSTWTTGGNLSLLGAGAAGAGIQTAALAFGRGASGAPAPTPSSTEEYDGTSWTAGGSLNTGRLASGGCGTQTAALAFGGDNPTPGYLSATEEYDGTSWASNPTGLNTARTALAGAGTQTAALAFGGYTGADTGVTELYNGTTWTSNPTGLNTARRGLAGAGIQTAGLAFGGVTTSSLAATEEYVDNSPYAGQTVQNLGQVWYNTTTKALKYTNETFTSTWATGTSYPSPASYNLGGTGIQTAGLFFGGTPPQTNATNEYDGSAWTAGGTLATASQQISGAGTQTAGLAIGGKDTSPGSAPYALNRTEEYDGASWTSGGTLGTARYSAGSAGTQTASLVFGGESAPTGGLLDTTELYNGTSWTTSPATLGAAQYRFEGCGTQTAALASQGNPVPALSGPTQEFDGSTWTAGGTLNTILAFRGISGIQTSAVIFGGGTPPSSATETYDGTSWSTDPASMNTGRYLVAPARNSQSTALAVGGASPTITQAVEEWTKTGAYVIKTVTVS